MEDLLQLDNRIERQNDENGQKDNVQKIKKHKSAGSRQQSTEANASEMFPLTQDKIELLKISESLTEIIETYNTKIEVTRDGIKISGEESKIDKVKLLIMQKLINVVQSSPKISRGAYNFLKTNAGKHSVDKFFYGMNVKVVWKLNQSNTEISLMSFSPSEMEIVKKALEENLQDVDIPLSNTEQQILKTDRGNTFIEDLRSRNAVSVEFHESKLVISGISLETSNAKRQIKKFIKINETGSKIITVKRGMFRFLFESAKSKLTDLEQKLKEQLVTIGKTPKHKNIVVIGCKLGLQNAISSVTELIADVYTKEMVLERPGIGKLFQKSLIKSAISGLEKEFNVVVIEAADDIEDPEEEPKVKTERSVSSGTLICCYQIQDKKTISVYHGDITKESVDIIVNPANRNLWLGGGVAGAILSAGGKAIQNECKKYIKEHEELEEGDIAVTNSGKLLCKKIVHAVGPKWPTEERHIGEKELASRRKNAEDNLNLVIKNTLQAAEKYCSIAIPAISSGVFGFPKDLCAEIILSAVCSFLKDNSSTKLQDIRLVNNDKETVNVFSKLFQKQFGASDNFVACSKDEELLPTPQSEREEYLKAGVRHAVPDKMSPPTSTKEDSVDSSITQNGITTELVIGDISKEKVRYDNCLAKEVT